MHKRIALAACTLVVAFGLLAVESGVSSAATKGNFPTYGWVYGVGSMDTWNKALPKGREGQDKYDRENILATHYVFETSTDTTRNNLNQQKALHRAVADGWQAVAVDDG